MRHSSALRSHRNFRRSWAGSQTWTEHPGWTRLYLTVAREHWVHHSKIDRRMAEMGLIHVIPAIPACPVCPEGRASFGPPGRRGFARLRRRVWQHAHLVNVCFAPKATEVLHCREPVIRSPRRRGRAAWAEFQGRATSPFAD